MTTNTTITNAKNLYDDYINNRPTDDIIIKIISRLTITVDNNKFNEIYRFLNLVNLKDPGGLDLLNDNLESIRPLDEPLLSNCPIMDGIFIRLAGASIILQLEDIRNALSEAFLESETPQIVKEARGTLSHLYNILEASPITITRDDKRIEEIFDTSEVSQIVRGEKLKKGEILIFRDEYENGYIVEYSS